MKTKYFTFYAFLSILLAASIAGRIWQVKHQAKIIPPSISQQWAELGTPVITQTVTVGDYIIERPCYGMIDDKDRFVCYLPTNQAHEVQAGAQFRSAPKNDFTQSNFAFTGSVRKINLADDDVGIAEIQLRLDPSSITGEGKKYLGQDESAARYNRFAELYIQGPHYPQSIFIPRDAVQNIDGKNVVWLNRQNSAVAVNVETGESDDQNIRIISGLQAGDEIIIKGQSKVSNDTKLHVLAQN